LTFLPHVSGLILFDAQQEVRATARKKLNKSAKIREAFWTMGLDARPKDVIEALAARRIKVTAAAVSNVKAKLGVRRDTHPRKDGMITISDLAEANKFVKKLGMQTALAAVNALSKLR
jgi:hypothetical protein